MTFRDPLTAATALDTGAAPGHTSVYIDQLNGLIGLRGFLGNDTASIIQRQPGTPGGRLRIDGGGYAQGNSPRKAGPVLDFEVTSASGSPPYTSTLRVSAADAIDLSGADIKPQARAFVATWAAAAGFRDWPGGQERPEFVHHGDGLITFTGLAQNNSGATRGGVGTSTQIATIPAGFVPPVNTIRTALANGSVNCRVDFSNDGHLYLVDCPVIPVGSQLVFGVAYRLDATASA